MIVVRPALLFRAHRALHLSQGGLGRLLGASQRTGQRWCVGESHPTQKQVHALVGHVHRVNTGLAEEIAHASGTTLVALGLVEPPPAPTPPAPPPPPPAPTPPPPFVPPADRIVDSVVCAAAEAMDVMPRAIRPALLAAFTRAREIGLRVEELERALRPAPKPRGESRGKAAAGAKKPE